MIARSSTRLLLAFAAFAVLGSFHAHAQSIYLCLGSSSTSLTPALYATCAGDGTTQNASKLLSLSFGVTSTVSGTATKTQVSSLTLQKLVDDTSVNLVKHLVAGTHLKTLAIGITAPNASGTVASNITIVLSGAFVTSVQNGGSAGGGVYENVTLSFQTIEVIDNTTTPPTIFTWKSL